MARRAALGTCLMTLLATVVFAPAQAMANAPCTKVTFEKVFKDITTWTDVNTYPAGTAAASLPNLAGLVGTGTIKVAATGRNFIGLNEFTVLVRIPTLYIGTGEYWFNVTPECTNGATDGSCSVGRIFISNTTQNTNGVFANAQPAGSMFLNSPFFGFTWANWCDASLGLNSSQCRAASFGLTGTAHHD